MGGWELGIGNWEFARSHLQKILPTEIILYPVGIVEDWGLRSVPRYKNHG